MMYALLRLLSITGCWVLCGSAAWTQSRATLQESLDLDIPVAPQRVNVGGQERLVYELHLTNLLGADVILSRVQVIDGATGQPVADLNGPALREALSVAAVGNDTGRARLANGMHVVVYLWATLSPRRQPVERIMHRIEYDVLRSSGPRQSVSVTAEVAVRSTQLVLGPPLRGGPWVALYDPAMMGGHRRRIYTLAGRARIPARFAIDWVLLDQHGNAARGDAGKVATWHGCDRRA
jgi:murein DD-endopeptidase